jgi:thiaminase (transcriptional activator TenA)
MKTKKQKIASTFTKFLWNENKALYDKTLNLPFNQELASGTLDVDKFKYYIIQDYLYLKIYSKVLAILATKAVLLEERIFWLNSSKGILDVEASVHRFFMKTFTIPIEEVDNIEMSPTTNHYTAFLLAAVSHESYEIGVAAVLPCFWIYGEVGKALAKITEHKRNTLYKKWIENYAGADFQNAVKEAVQLTENTAKNASTEIKKKMEYAYKRSAQLEYLFWDAAYKKQTWVE